MTFAPFKSKFDYTARIIWGAVLRLLRLIDTGWYSTISEWYMRHISNLDGAAKNKLSLLDKVHNPKLFRFGHTGC